jgi:Radical SAM superfamily
MTDVVIFSSGRIRNLAPHRIATEIRNAGYSCQVVNYISIFKLSEIEKVCEKFIDQNTKIVGLSTTFWYENENITYTILLDTIKKINPEIKIIIGGVNARKVSSMTMHKIDAIFLGQGEGNILRFLDHIYNNKPFIEPTSIWRENIPVYESAKIDPEWDFNSSKTEYIPEDCIDYGEPLVLEVGRGCIFNCKFCGFMLNGKKKTDYIKYADTLYDELIKNYNSNGTHTYILSDDTFNDNLDKLKILKDVFTNLPFKFTFTSYLRLDLLNAHREEISMLEEMGMIGAFFGIETFHDKAAKLIGKGIVGKISKQLLHELKTVHWKDRIKIAIGLIQGLPYETYESYEETKKWISDPENLIEGVRNNTLNVINPAKDFYSDKSEFQLNSTKYGFYWPNNHQNPYHWKNYTGPVKSYEEATKIWKGVTAASIKMSRFHPGGFETNTYYRFSKYFSTPKTLDDMLSMDRYEFSNLINNEYSIVFAKYISNYKKRILNL